MMNKTASAIEAVLLLLGGIRMNLSFMTFPMIRDKLQGLIDAETLIDIRYRCRAHR